MIKTDLFVVVATECQQYALECFRAELQFLLERKIKIKKGMFFESRKRQTSESWPKAALNVLKHLNATSGKLSIVLIVDKSAPVF